MATIKDIAAYTGVSPTTVSNVIHGRDAKVSKETKDKVEKALKELDYTANMGGRLLAKHGSRIIGMIIQDTEAEKEEFFDNPYHGELIQALESKIKKAGYFMMFQRVSSFEEGAKLVEMWHLEGLIVSGTSNDDIHKWQEKVKVPIVFIDSYGEKENQPLLNVGIDDKKGAYEMTKYLISMGHEKIAFVAKGDVVDSWQGVDFERALGVKEAMKENKLEAEFIVIPSTYKNYQTYLDEHLKPRLSDLTALFCASDLVAVQIVSELYKQDVLVPRDISIVSFDGTPYSRFATPQITSMYQDVSQKATAILDLMMKAIYEKEKKQRRKEIKTELVLGESVKDINRIENG